MVGSLVAKRNATDRCHLSDSRAHASILWPLSARIRHDSVALRIARTRSGDGNRLELAAIVAGVSPTSRSGAVLQSNCLLGAKRDAQTRPANLRKCIERAGCDSARGAFH